MDARRFATYLAVVISPAVVGLLADELGLDEVTAMNKYFASSAYAAISDEEQKLCLVEILRRQIGVVASPKIFLHTPLAQRGEIMVQYARMKNLAQRKEFAASRVRSPQRDCVAVLIPYLSFYSAVSAVVI